MKRIEEILEKTFDRGYHHGVSMGQSEDGETYAVCDAKAELKELFKSVVPEELEQTEFMPNNKALHFNNCREEILKRLEKL